MKPWSMNDGSALSGTYTFTNGSAIVQGNSSADTSEIKWVISSLMTTVIK